MKLWKRFAVAAFVAFLFYFCQILSNGLDVYKNSVCWDCEDLLAILTGIAALTAIAVAADALVAWSGSRWLRRLFNHVFLLALMTGVLAVGGRVFLPLIAVEFMWMALMVVLGLSFGRPQWKLDYYAAKACLLFSPAIAVGFIYLFATANRPVSLDVHFPREPVAASQVRKTPVFFFVIDEWSYQRSVNEGKFHPELKNLRALAAESVVFSNAVSPASQTFQSLPAYIYQTDKIYQLRDGKFGFEDCAKFIPSTQMPSLFQAAREQGYRTYLTGFYHAYEVMLGSQVDSYRAHYSSRPPCDSFGSAFLWTLERNCRFLNDPISVECDLKSRVIGHQGQEMNEAFREEILDFLDRPHPNTFAFFHTSWMHAPLATNADGTYSGYSGIPIDRADVIAYQRHLQYIDNAIGEIVAKLRSAGHYNDAMLILTSDHSWRIDPDMENSRLPLSVRRVPLIIKLPGEKSGHILTKEFCPNRLQPLLNAVFVGEKDPQTLLSILEKTVEDQPPLLLENEKKGTSTNPIME